MRFDRRQLLKALGFTALSSLAPRSMRAAAQAAGAPSRIVFFVQPHGHVPSSWIMPIPAAKADAVAQRSLRALGVDDFSEVLKPLFAFRDRLLVVEGLSHLSVLSDLAQIDREGSGDDNNHNVAVAGLLTAARALQRSGIPCTGGARSIDQELAKRSSAPGRFASRVYGADYVPNQAVAPFSFLDSGLPTPIVADPATGFADLSGFVTSPATGPLSRAEQLRALRGSVLDTVSDEYAALSRRLGKQDRDKLDAHHALVRDLELSLAASAPARCTLDFDASGDSVTPFMRLIRMALACDLTRVVTYVAPVPQCPEFGYPADANVHSTYAHGSVQGSTSCGQAYAPLAERAMTDLSVWYAKHFVQLLQELDSVVEGSGTLLDHTTVVWLTELGTPTHQHHDTFSLIAGGTNGFFGQGRYLRYPRTLQDPHKRGALIGPAQSRLFVSLLQAMGQSDDSFGITDALGADGATLSLRGPLTDLHRG